MTIQTNAGCTQIDVATPGTDFLEDWYTGAETGVEITWSLNDCTDNVVALPNRYAFNGTITNCVKSSGSHTFRLNITGINVGNVATISVTGSTNLLSGPTQVSTLVWAMEVSDAVIVSNDATVTFRITDTSGNVYTVVYTITHTSGAVNCDSIVLLGNNPTYPSLPCGMEYDNTTHTATFYYPFFFGGDCSAETQLPCGVYNISLGGESSCVFVCCEFDCLASSALTIDDLGEKLDVYQALLFWNELNAADNSCANCNAVSEIYAYFRSLTKTISNDNIFGCGCG